MVNQINNGFKEFSIIFFSFILFLRNSIEEIGLGVGGILPLSFSEQQVFCIISKAICIY